MTRIEEIKQRVDAATEWPWEGEVRKAYLDSKYIDAHSLDSELEYIISSEGDFLEVIRADATFIAHAREDIPYLLQRIEVLEGALNLLRRYHFGDGSISRADVFEALALKESEKEDV
jgi:hypothetical protein